MVQLFLRDPSCYFVPTYGLTIAANACLLHRHLSQAHMGQHLSLGKSMLGGRHRRLIASYYPLCAVTAPHELQDTPQPSQDARTLAIAESKGSADARQAAESAQRRIDIAVEATKRLDEVRHVFRSHACWHYLRLC